MKTAALPVFNGLVLPLILGLLIAGIAYSVLNGKQIPLINGPRAALIAFLIIGMTMCFLGGIGQVGASGKWASPLAIVGYLIGVAILVVIIGALAGWKLPIITSLNDAVYMTAVLIGVKFVIGTLGNLFHLI